MKPTSVIFLIVSIVLVIGGFATAGVAKQIAASEGIDLSVKVDESAEPASLKYEYGDDVIEKIKISVNNASVNIIGGSDKPYVELINFTEGMYSFSPSNRVLDIKEGMNFASVSEIMSVVTSFKGLRSFVNYYHMRELEKTVNIYICDTAPVNKIEVSLNVGDVVIRDITAATDYSIDIDAGELNITNVNTTSLIEAEVDAGDINIDGGIIERAELDVDMGDINIKAKINRLDADIDAGGFNLDYADSLKLVNLKLYAIVGDITVDGEEFAGYRVIDDIDTQNVIDVSVSSGDIAINSGVFE